MRKTPHILTATAALALIVTSVAPALAHRARPAPPPLVNADKSPTPYAGDCGPNPPPGYRYDLEGWRTGFNRDFYCYMLDEN
jgi:hypothetical protein